MTQSKEQMQKIYDEYLNIANSEVDPWHRTELRNAAYAVKLAIIRADLVEKVKGELE